VYVFLNYTSVQHRHSSAISFADNSILVLVAVLMVFAYSFQNYCSTVFLRAERQHKEDIQMTYLLLS